MQRRQHRQRHRENKNAVDEPDSSAEPPGGYLQRLKGGNVNERENPAVYEMQKEADELRFVATGREDCPARIEVSTTVLTKPHNSQLLQFMTRNYPSPLRCRVTQAQH